MHMPDWLRIRCTYVVVVMPSMHLHAFVLRGLRETCLGRLKWIVDKNVTFMMQSAMIWIHVCWCGHAILERIGLFVLCDKAYPSVGLSSMLCVIVVKRGLEVVRHDVAVRGHASPGYHVVILRVFVVFI